MGRISPSHFSNINYDIVILFINMILAYAYIATLNQHNLEVTHILTLETLEQGTEPPTA